MDDLPGLIALKDGNAMTSIIDWFRSKHLELINSLPLLIPDFVTELFEYFSKPPDNCSSDEWSQFTLIAYAFILSLSPPAQVIPSIDLVHGYPPLILSSLLLSQRRETICIPISLYKEIFCTVPKLVKPSQSHRAFYTITPIYYYMDLPSYLNQEVNTHEFQQTTDDFLIAFSQIPVEKMPFDYIIFASETL
jgi:hypothetical protein